MHRFRRQKQTDTNYTTEQIRRVIDGIGFDIESEVDSDYIVFCPFHNNYRSPAAEISKETGMFWCFSCQTSKDLIALVMYQSGRSYYEALRYIDRKADKDDIEAQINKDLAPAPTFSQFDEILIKRLNKQAMQSSRAISYFESRRITQDSMANYMLGYSEKQDMVTVPVTSPDGMFIGFVGRSVEGKTFRNTPGLPKSKTLFNLSRVKLRGTVYVVESTFDAIRLEQAGVAAVGTLGSTISKVQIELLTRYFNNVTLVPDNDLAGKEMARRLHDSFPAARIANLPDDVKDIGDLPDAELKNFVADLDDPLAAML